jgi:putative phosphonate metabolism protein
MQNPFCLSPADQPGNGTSSLVVPMRYAIYYAPPPSSLLWQWGSRWLGRDARSGQLLTPPRFRGIDPERIAELTRLPRHYGFHATMTPPFRLNGKTTEAQLIDVLVDFVSRQQSLTIPGLELSQMNGFFCLQPARHSSPLQTLASLCMRAFDHCRAPLTPSELARRKTAVLSGQEKRNLELWGYPYVFEQFRFHFTLTARLSESREQELIHSALAEIFSPLLADPLVIDGLCLFVEPPSGQPMRCLHQFPFAPMSFGHEESTTHDHRCSEENLYPGYQCHSA